MNIHAKNHSELNTALESIDTHVPLRTKGRKTEHVEIHSIVNLVRILASSGLLTYPLELLHQDRPDFVLKMPNRIIGIEHTEAISQNEAAKAALREQGYDDSRGHFMTRAFPGEERRDKAQLIEEIERNEPGHGWTGDQSETEWASAMLHVLEEKQGKLKNYDSAMFDEVWLLIYDNWRVPALDLEISSSYFTKSIAQRTIPWMFDQVFVIRSKFVSVFGRGGYKVLGP